MNEIIEIKRKEFTVLEKLGERSFKVERKGKIYFLKKYNTKQELQQFEENQHKIRFTALDLPKVYLFDKNQLMSVVDFIEGDNMLDLLAKEDISNEIIYKFLFAAEWYARREKLMLDYRPENFKFDGRKLYYLPFTSEPLDPKYNFSMSDLRLWFPTKQLASYIKSKGIEFDDKRTNDEYAVNKQIALMAVKYYI